MILGIYGAGGLGREVLELARQINYVSPRWEDILFVDDFTDDTYVGDTQVVPFKSIDVSCEFIIAVGEPSSRYALFEKVIQAHSLATLIHPSVHIPKDVKIEDGVVIYSGAFISCNVSIKRNSLILPNVCIGHDAIIGAHSVVAGQTSIGGNVTLGEKVFVGMSCAIREKVKIGDNAIVSMGSCVFGEIGDNCLVMGNPARPLKSARDGKVFNTVVGEK